MLDFDEGIQNLSYAQFLGEIKKKIPFQFLVLGQGASLGKGRQGDQTHIKPLESSLDFKSYYIEKATHEGEVISSQAIRELLQQGEVEKAKHLLGRSFALYGPNHLIKLQETGDKRMKLTFDFQNHCFLPSGFYIINLKNQERECVAAAILTTLDCKDLGKTFDLDIYIKQNLTAFLNDQVVIEFLRKTPPIDFDDHEGASRAKIIPLSLQ